MSARSARVEESRELGVPPFTVGVGVGTRGAGEYF